LALLVSTQTPRQIVCKNSNFQSINLSTSTDRLWPFWRENCYFLQFWLTLFYRFRKHEKQTQNCYSIQQTIIPIILAFFLVYLWKGKDLFLFITFLKLPALSPPEFMNSLAKFIRILLKVRFIDL
jgi:hypothetical protein